LLAVRISLIQRSDDGFLFPYDGVHVDFLLKAA
jgi:hypothetical protein